MTVSGYRSRSVRLQFVTFPSSACVLVWTEQTRKCRQNTCWEKVYIYFHLSLYLFFSKLRKLGWYLYSYLIFIFSSLPNSSDPKYPNRKIRRLCLPFPLNTWKRLIDLLKTPVFHYQEWRKSHRHLKNTEKRKEKKYSVSGNIATKIV